MPHLSVNTIASINWAALRAAGFKGVPVPADETEMERILRDAITKDVFHYFQESGRQLMIQKGQPG
jgi:hypothetical protein